MPQAAKKDAQVNVRVDRDMFTDLEAIALIEDTTVSELGREALAMLIADRREDPEFQSKRLRALERQQQLLERLA